MITRLLPALIFLAGFAVSPLATAQNWRFLKDAPIGYFTPKDSELFKTNLRDALDNGKDGERRSWSNSASGAAGSATLEETLRQGDNVCRRVRLDNHAKGHGGFTHKTFCKRSGKNWQVQP
jgi:surface antigen